MSGASETEDSENRPAQERARAVSGLPELPSFAIPRVNGDNPTRRRRVRIPDFSVTKHEDQPHERMASDKAVGELLQQLPSATDFWRKVVAMYQLSRAMVLMRVELKDTEFGKEWLGIMNRRIEWMEEDEKTLLSAVLDNFGLSCTVSLVDLG